MAKTTWVLVADGARAHFYANDSGRLAPALDHDLTAPTRAHVREVEADRPGRAFDSAGQGRHAMEPRSDRKSLERKALAEAVAQELRLAAEREAFGRLVVVAPPDMLGDLRQAFRGSISHLVVAEIGKDLTQVPVHDLPGHLGETLRG